VKTAGNFIATILSAKFASRMENGHDHLKGRDFGLFVYVDGDTATIVDHAHAIVREKRDFNIIGEASHSFVAGVVEDFGYEMMETVGTRSSDVHSGTLAHRLKAFQDLDRISPIAALFLAFLWFFFGCHFGQNKRSYKAFLMFVL
jgi:hypothetical protein